MKPFFHHFFRLDPRSLGLFRILFGLALLCDLSYRWDHLEAFYTNEGVLPNHLHIYNLKQAGHFLWSALHAFTTDGEAYFGFCVILFFYACFTIGYKTRAFHILSAVSLLSLATRNTLASGPGDYLAIAMILVTAFLPLGSAFSVDAFLRRARAARETPHEKLNDRSNLPSDELVDANRLPGWAPRSIAALGVLVLISLVMFTLASKQNGAAWKDGTALAKAMHLTLFASPFGWGARDAGWLGPLTRVVYYAQWVIPVLLVVPVGRGIARGAAAVLLAIHGLTYGLLTNLGLFGWTIFASSVAVISGDTWHAWATRHDPKRVRTVIYDADCGVCFFLCQLLKRWDTRRHLVFQPNDEREKLRIWEPKKQKIVRREMPAQITADLVDQTVVAVRPDSSFATRGAAAAEVLLALPGFGLLGGLLKLPLFSQLADALYDVFAPRRTAVSIELGMAACGVEPPADAPKGYRDTPGAAGKAAVIPPARVLKNRITGGVREVLAAVFVLSLFVQTVGQNQLSANPPESEWLSSVSWWTHTKSDWSILAPEPAADNAYMVIDAYTRSEASIDPLTGKEPKLAAEEAFGLGPLWASYLAQIRLQEQVLYQPAFRTYVSKRGPRWPADKPDDKLLGADAYWVVAPAGGGSPASERLFRHGRGGKVLGDLGAADKPAPVRRVPVPGAEPGKVPIPRPTALPRQE